MRRMHNPGRVAGLWYLILALLGPVRLIYIPDHVFVEGNAGATASNIAAHEMLVRLGVAADLVCAVVLVFLTLAFFRLFKDVDRNLAVLVVILGGIMPSLLYFVGVVADLGALMVVRDPGFLSAFDKPQQDALAMLLLRLRGTLNTAAEILWGAWLFPLGILIYKSRFIPRFLGVWLVLGGVAYVILSFTGVLAPQYQGTVFRFSQSAFFGELAIVLWLVIRGAQPPSPAEASD